MSELFSMVRGDVVEEVCCVIIVIIVMGRMRICKGKGNTIKTVIDITIPKVLKLHYYQYQKKKRKKKKNK